MHYSEIKSFMDDRVLITLYDGTKILSTIEEVTKEITAIKRSGYTRVLKNDVIRSVQSSQIKFLFPYQVVCGPNLATNNKRTTQADITNIMELLKKMKKYELITRSKCFVKEVIVDKRKQKREQKKKPDVEIKKRKQKETLEIETFSFLPVDKGLKICPFALIRTPSVAALFAVDHEGNPRLLNKRGHEIIKGKRFKKVIKYISKVKLTEPKFPLIKSKSKKEWDESAPSLARILKD